VNSAIRLYRVAYSWRRYGKLFSAHTIWGARSVELCKADFARRNPHVLSFRIESEVQP